jgi:hypothetical protein
VNFVETLTNKHPTFHVIEEIVTTNREMNTAVQFCAKDGTILYDVPNIRKLKKINQNTNATNDAVVDDIVTKIVEYYTKFFQYVVPKEKLTFGFSDDEDETFEINQFGSVTTNVLQEMKNTNNKKDDNNQKNNIIVKSKEPSTSSNTMKLSFDDFNDFDNDEVVEKPKQVSYTFSMDEDF